MELDATTIPLPKIVPDETPYDESKETRFYVQANGDKNIIDLVFAPCTLEHVVKILNGSGEETFVSQKCKDMVPKKYLLQTCQDCGKNLFHKSTKERTEGGESYLLFAFGCGCEGDKLKTYYKEYRMVKDNEIEAINKEGKEQLLKSFL